MHSPLSSPSLLSTCTQRETTFASTSALGLPELPTCLSRCSRHYYRLWGWVHAFIFPQDCRLQSCAAHSALMLCEEVLRWWRDLQKPCCVGSQSTRQVVGNTAFPVCQAVLPCYRLLVERTADQLDTNFHNLPVVARLVLFRLLDKNLWAFISRARVFRAAAGGKRQCRE